MTSSQRFGLFVIIFGLIMGIVIWQAGGIGLSGGDGDVHGGGRGDTTTIPIARGTSLGEGAQVRIARDQVEVVDGTPHIYRAFESTWERQEPRPGGAPGRRRLHTETVVILVFHQKPTADDLRPPAIEGPNTSRIDSETAELSIGESEDLQAELSGNVVLVRHGDTPDDDLVVRTDRLFCDTTDRTAKTDEPVTLNGRGIQLDAVGMDAELEVPEISGPRLELRRDVVGTFLTRPGALTGEGGLDTGEPVITTVRCAGTAHLAALPPDGRAGPRRWRAIFRDDVVVEQGDSTLRCQRLEIDFMMGTDEPAANGRNVNRIENMVADGDVVVSRLDPLTGDTLRLTCDRSETRRGPKGEYLVDLLGGTHGDFRGALGGTDADGRPGRVEVQCSGKATIQTDAKPPQPDTPLRGRIHFQEDVVAKQWDADGNLLTTLTAPSAWLLGNRVQAEGGRFDPETLTASGTAEERVHVIRDGLDGYAEVATWRVLRGREIERLLLQRSIDIHFEDASGMNLTGSGRAQKNVVLHLSADDSAEVRTIREATAPDMPPPEKPFVTAQASGNVVVRRLVDGVEAYRMRSDAADLLIDSDRQPQHLRAYGNVSLTGRGEREGDAAVHIVGDRLVAQQEAATEPAVGSDPAEQADPWTRTQVIVYGNPTVPARATVDDTRPDDLTPRVHVIYAQELRYENGGTLITARNDAHALLDRRAAATDVNTKDKTAGRIEIVGQSLVAHLRQGEDATSEDGGPSISRLRQVVADRGVRIDSETYSVTGDRTTYDHVTGLAVAEGRPARAVLRGDGESVEDSFVNSETIRVEFDPTDESGSRKPRRVTCEGGIIRRYLVDGSGPLRVTVKASGPIEILPNSGSARDDVSVVYESRTTETTWRQEARVLCDSLRMTFDPDGTGKLENRVTSAVADGTRGRPARLMAPRFDAVVDRVEAEGSVLKMSSPYGRKTQIDERDPVRSYSFDSGSWNFRTYVWENVIRPEYR